VKQLAEGIYRERAFDRLPILADALEEVGCTSNDVLNHCRQPGDHVRGCWAVDLVWGGDAVTEEEWNVCQNPGLMIEELGYRATPREVRLFHSSSVRLLCGILALIRSKNKRGRSWDAPLFSCVADGAYVGWESAQGTLLAGHAPLRRD
jgi:hypothetical protein